MNRMSDATKPLLRIRANASENVKGIVSCEATVEIVEDSIKYFNGGIGALNDIVAVAIENQLTRMHEVLRSKGHKLAVDGGV